MEQSAQPSPITAPILPKPFWKTPRILLAILAILAIAGITTLAILQKNKAATTVESPASTPAPKISIPCPADSSFCQEPKEIMKDGRFGGLGAKVPENTPIYAVFDGVLASSRAILFGPDSKIAPFVQIILKANDSTLPQAVYLIHPTAKGGITKMSFKKGEIIATVSAKLLTYFGDYNLIFALMDKDGLLSKDRTEFIK